MAGLAILSTCRTATGDESLSEKAVRLAAAMLMAGGWMIVATMWLIGGEDASFFAEEVFDNLLGGLPNLERVATAAYKATEHSPAKGC